MKKATILILICLLVLTLVACDPTVKEPVDNMKTAEEWGLDVNSPTTYRRPYAQSDPNNPKDTKVHNEFTQEDADNALHSGSGDVCIVIELTNSESINNLFYDYTLDDFGVEYHIDTEFSTYFMVHTERNVRKDYRIDEYRSILCAGEKIDFTQFNRIVEIDVTYNDIRNGEAIKIANDISKIDFVRNIRLRNVGWMTTTPEGYAEDILWASEKINLREAWDYTTGSPNVTVGVIDSGVLSTHVALQHAHNSSLDHYDDLGADNYGHGTMVVGVMFAKDSTSGVYGVCHDAKYASLKGCIGSENERIDIVTQRIIDAQSDGIQVLNFSGGFYETPLDSNDPVPTQQEINALYSAIENYDGLLVVAAGNQGFNLDTNTNKLYPQCFDLPNIIVVGSSTSNDDCAGYSNKGKQTVDLLAPGNNVYTTKADGTYGATSGTSMAAPFVAGVAALLKSYDYTLTTAQIKEAILNSVTEVSDLDGLCVSGGILNAQAALEYVCKHECTTATSTNSTHHTGICNLCGKNVVDEHEFSYTKISVSAGHRCSCSVCGYVGTEFHEWQPRYLMNEIRGYECKQCGIFALNIDIAHPGSLRTEVLQSLTNNTSSHDTSLTYINEHVALLSCNGKYSLLIECDENCRPLADIPEGIFVDEYDISELQYALQIKLQEVVIQGSEEIKWCLDCNTLKDNEK